MKNKTEISFKYLKFKPMAWEEWLQEYKHDIRIAIQWKKLRKPRKLGAHLVTKQDELYLPWYGKGSWMERKPPIKVEAGKNLILVRLPAIRMGENTAFVSTGKTKELQNQKIYTGGKRFFVPDGCHRLTEMKPKIVILDWIELREGDERFVVDLYNEFWKDLFGRGNV